MRNPYPSQAAPVGVGGLAGKQSKGTHAYPEQTMTKIFSIFSINLF